VCIYDYIYIYLGDDAHCGLLELARGVVLLEALERALEVHVRSVLHPPVRDKKEVRIYKYIYIIYINMYIYICMYVCIHISGLTRIYIHIFYI